MLYEKLEFTSLMNLDNFFKWPRTSRSEFTKTQSILYFPWTLQLYREETAIVGG